LLSRENKIVKEENLKGGRRKNVEKGKMWKSVK